MIRFYNGEVCSGHLTRYAAEIEMYHMPAVDEQK